MVKYILSGSPADSPTYMFVPSPLGERVRVRGNKVYHVYEI